MPIELALALILAALLIGLVFGGLALQWAQEEGEGENEPSWDYPQPSMTVGRFGAVRELRPDGYWYVDGKRVV